MTLAAAALLTGIAATLATVAAGAWIDAGEPVVLLGDSGTGKTHLLIGLGLDLPRRSAPPADAAARPGAPPRRHQARPAPIRRLEHRLLPR
jgi:hypothetical protein